MDKIDDYGNIDTNKFIKIFEIDNSSNIQIRKKMKEAFHVSYKNELKIEQKFICYRHPRLIGKIFDNNNLDFDICFTNVQLEESLFNNKQYNYERFSLNSNKTGVSNFFY